MLSLSRPLNDVIEVEEVQYSLDLSFDNVLRILELWHDEGVHSLVKSFVALEMLTGVNLSEIISLEDSFKLFQLIFDEHISSSDSSEEIEVDLEGNPLPIQKGLGKDKPLYSLVHDSEYIYASFMQAYGMDLIEQQGKLHWRKFNALLSGLPETTKLIQVIKIRSWKPEKEDTTKYKESMRKLQKEFELPPDTKY